MRITTLLLLAGLGLPSLLVDSHAGGERSAQEQGSQDERKNPFLRGQGERPPTLEEKENARLEKELQGSWMMTSYLRADTIIPNTEVKGFAMVNDGYLMFSFQALEDQQDFFFAEDQYVVQSAVFRYQIFEGRLLQVAGLQGYTNDNEDYELEFGSIRIPREYQITLVGDSLTLKRVSGVGFEFRRMRRTAFPQAAVDRLRRQRSGFELIDDVDPFQGAGADDSPAGQGSGDGDG